jgi:outer membrane protein
MCLIFLFLLVAAPVWSQQTIKVGVIALQEAISSSIAGKRAKEKFQAEVKGIEAELLREQREIEDLKTSVEKKGVLLKEEERRSLERDFQRRYRDYQRKMRDVQEELRQKESEMTGEILKGLETAVTEIGKNRGFTLILARDQVLYTNNGIDITKEVVKLYDSRYGNDVTKLR